MQNDTQAPEAHVTVKPAPPRVVSSSWAPIPSEEERAERQRQRDVAEALKAQEDARLERLSGQIYASMAIEEAQAALEETRRYEEAGALLRANARRRRQEHHCRECGFLFNYLEGRLLPEDEWCDPRLKYCQAGIGNPFCLTLRDTQERAKKRRSTRNNKRH